MEAFTLYLLSILQELLLGVSEPPSAPHLWRRTSDGESQALFSRSFHCTRDGGGREEGLWTASAVLFLLYSLAHRPV